MIKSYPLEPVLSSFSVNSYILSFLVNLVCWKILDLDETALSGSNSHINAPIIGLNNISFTNLNIL